MKKGDQVFTTYGKRTNQFLMKNYGFCISQNRYDSYEINLRMDYDIEKDKDICFQDMLSKSPNSEDERQRIRLKEYQLNFILLAYIRYYKQNIYFVN